MRRRKLTEEQAFRWIICAVALLILSVLEFVFMLGRRVFPKVVVL